MTKKLLFDGTALQSNHVVQYHGGSEYAKFILTEAIKYGFKFDIVLNPNMIIEDSILELLRQNDIGITHIKSNKDLYENIDKMGYEIFYSALPYKFYDYNANAKFIGVIHGLRNIEIIWDKYKHKFYNSIPKRLIGWGISKMGLIQCLIKNKRANDLKKLISIPNSKFIVVSNHTKHSILNFFPSVSPNQIQVFYSPIERVEIMNRKSKYKRPYFLLVSGNRFEKNTYRAIKAFDLLFSENRIEGYNVIVTGAENIPFKSNIRNIHRFILLPYVGHDELLSLYENAYCLIYPSLNEGFGYPPVISMQLNVPVISSCATSIPEVCDNAALYFEPYSIDELKNRILQISYNSNLYNELIVKGKHRAQELLAKQDNDILIYLNEIFK